MFGPRKTQTKVKHIILDKYLKAWGGIIAYGTKTNIINALNKGKPAELYFVYVDCFAGPGRYDGEIDEEKLGIPRSTVFGSPIIGINALDSLAAMVKGMGIPVRTNAILVERDSDIFDSLKESLDMASLTPRIKETYKFYTLDNTEVAIVNADSTTLVDDLLDFTTNIYGYSFYFLDVFGPTGIPLYNVGRIISNERHDTLINMPYQDLHKKSGFFGTKELTQGQISILQNYDNMFGNDGWQDIAKEWMNMDDDSRRSEELEFNLADHYRQVLLKVDPELSVKSLPLKFPDKDRTMFHLYLTTHNATGSIQMNKIIQDESYTENHLRFRLRDIMKTKGGAQTSMFGAFGMDAPPKELPRNKSDEISELIEQEFTGQMTNKRQIYEFLADELYTPGEISKALTHMKKSDKASFKPSAGQLKHDTPISIL